MLLPLIVPIAPGLAGIFGIGKAVKGYSGSSDADDINASAECIVEDAERELEARKPASRLAPPTRLEGWRAKNCNLLP